MADDPHTNRINRYDGQAVGVALFLTDDELRDAGVDPDDVDYVNYYVDDDGRVVLES